MHTDRRGWSLLSIIPIIITLCLIASSCTDKPPTITAPIKTQEYNLYFFDDNGSSYDYCLRFNTASGVFDSFPIPFKSYECVMTVSPDGPFMYLAKDNTIIEYSLDSYSNVRQITIPNLVNPQALTVSPNKQYLAINDVNRCFILRLADLEVVYQQEAYSQYGLFFTPNDSLLLYGSWDADNGFYLRTVDITNDFSVKTTSFNGEMVAETNSSRDGTIWYIYTHIDIAMFRFVIYDAIRDSVLNEENVAPGNGKIAVSPNDQFVAFSQAGTRLCVIPIPPTYFTLYNGYTHQKLRDVNTLLIDTDSVKAVWPTEDLFFTPDGNRLFGIASEGIQLFDYNPYTNEYNGVVAKYERFGHFLHFLGYRTTD